MKTEPGTTMEAFRFPTTYSKWLRSYAAKKKTTKTAIILGMMEKLIHPKK